MSPVQYPTGANGEHEFAVLPIDEYRRLVKRDMDATDIESARRAENDEDLPWEMVKRLLDGDNPIKVWRRHRGLTQAQLAETVGVNAGYLSQIETGRKRPSLSLARSLSAALDVMMDDLVVAVGEKAG